MQAPTTVHPPIPKNIPEKLKREVQWVNWSGVWSEDGTKLNKPPMKASGHNASSTDEKTWTTLDKSLAALGCGGVYVDNSGKRRHVTLDGVGFAGLERTPYTGIDLDHCINPDTGEINPAARKVVEAFDSYTETTPSGDGVRIWIEAEKPPTWSANKNGETEIEVYGRGRFFTVTGHHLEGTPHTIEGRQETLDAFMVEHAPPERGGKSERKPYTGPEDYVFDLERFLEEFGVAVLKQARDTTSDRAYYIVCPWAHEHTADDTSGTKVGQYPGGALWFECYHGHCDGRTWAQFREELDPEAYRRAAFTVGGRRLPDEEEEGSDGGGGLPPELDLTDLGNALRFARKFAGRLIYSPGAGGYAEYRDGRYVRDELGLRFELAKKIAPELMMEAAALAAVGDTDGAKKYSRHGINSASRPRLESMVALAHSDPQIAVATDLLDTDPYLFNCANGTIDLRTGERRGHAPADRITKISPVEYVKDAGCPTWDQFLEQILPDEGLRTFIKRWFGWCLTGIVNAEVLPIFYGTGQNGKSTLVNILLELLGDYGQQAPQDLLMVKRREHPTELADLFGCRLVASAESDENIRLNENLVKQLTGREKVRARYMRQDFFEFWPTHKLVLLTNHKPTIRGSDTGIWRRLRVVPFEVSIPKPEQDTSLPDKLRAELPGILRWAVEGCLEWRQDGVPEVAKITDASEQYKEEQDVIGAFLDECCILDQPEDVYVLMSTLYPTYQEWCKQSGEGALSKKHFGDRLTEKGYPPGRGPRNKPARRRITLRDDAPRPDGGGPRFDHAQGNSGYSTDSNEPPTNANNAKSQGNTCYPAESQGNTEKSCKTDESTGGVTLGYPKVDMNADVKASRKSHIELGVTQGNRVTRGGNSVPDWWQEDAEKDSFTTPTPRGETKNEKSEDGHEGRNKRYKLLSSSPEPPKGNDNDDNENGPTGTGTGGSEPSAGTDRSQLAFEALADESSGVRETVVDCLDGKYDKDHKTGASVYQGGSLGVIAGALAKYHGEAANPGAWKDWRGAASLLVDTVANEEED